MKRKLYIKLVDWKNSKERYPLILRGARQVGKSYLLKQFGQQEFSNYYTFDFEKDGNELKSLFNETISPHNLLKELSLFAEQEINPKRDLIIFDEIQNCPKALTSLKYFSEDIPELAICAAGSLLGTMLNKESFPVGKVSYLDLFPLNFEEFLLNINRPTIYNAFQDSFKNGKTSAMLHTKLWDILQAFYVVGGMPQIVKHYFSLLDQPARAFNEVRKMQQDLINTYMSDFNKHAGKINSLHITSVFENIPRQLATYIDGSVHRYRFKDVIPGKKGFTELDGPINWLIKAGLAIKVDICERSQIPLKSFCKPNMFKLFILDVGLLGQMLELTPKTIISQNYGLIKGFFVENFVATEFLAAGEQSLYSWTERNSEIEFIKDYDGELIPIEVKSSQRVKAKSLRQYMLKYNPPMAIVISGKPLKKTENQVKNYPLYYSGKLMETKH
jgi:uncharacterized protein